jgi:Glycoside-hydrolase family GH114
MFDARATERRFQWTAFVTACAVVIVGCSSAEHGSRAASGGSAEGDAAGSSGTSTGASFGGSSASSGQAGSSPGTSSAGRSEDTTNGGASQGGGNPGSAGTDATTNGGTGGTTNGGTGGTTNGTEYWKPSAGSSWQWQLTGPIDETVNVSVFDIDGFDNDASTVKALHSRGRKVICYLSVGSFEDWRPDAKSFPAAVLGKEYPGWPGERFVDIRAKALRDIMAARFDLCKQKGFDGIEPDNMDVYSADSGFPLTEKDGIDYANWLANEAHSRGLNIGQKNASEIATQLEPGFDWALTEDCYDQHWCADVSVYVDHDKPVFMSEYTDTGVDFGAACAWATPRKYSPILKGRDLDAPVQFCP